MRLPRSAHASKRTAEADAKIDAILRRDDRLRACLFRKLQVAERTIERLRHHERIIPVVDAPAVGERQDLTFEVPKLRVFRTNETPSAAATLLLVEAAQRNLADAVLDQDFRRNLVADA